MAVIKLLNSVVNTLVLITSNAYQFINDRIVINKVILLAITLN